MSGATENSVLASINNQRKGRKLRTEPGKQGSNSFGLWNWTNLDSNSHSRASLLLTMHEILNTSVPYLPCQ